MFMNGFRPILQRLGMAIGGLAAALLVLEIALRLASARGHDVFDEVASRPRPSKGRVLRLGDMLLPNPNDRIVFELRPDLDGTFEGRRVTTNSLGMRAPERPFEKPAGVFRIVGIGDSLMFGWGVAQDEAYPSQLERTLEERFPDRRFEVWNLAVPGYNAVQEVESLAEKIDRLDPDLIIAGWVGNDIDLPNFLAERPPVWSLDRSFLVDLVTRRFRGRASDDDEGLFAVPVDEETHRHLLNRDAIPERYWPLAGWDNMKESYRRLIAMTKSRGIPAVAVFTGGPRHFKTFCEEAGFLVVESHHRFVRFAREHGVDRREATQLSPSDPHPNAAGHALIAEALADRLVEANALAAGADSRP